MKKVDMATRVPRQSAADGWLCGDVLWHDDVQGQGVAV